MKWRWWCASETAVMKPTVTEAAAVKRDRRGSASMHAAAMPAATATETAAMETSAVETSAVEAAAMLTATTHVTPPP